MTAETTDTTTLAASAAVDSGLRCPECEYNLTGLTEPRCPECGVVFDWEEVRRAVANPPRIAFERAKRWNKVPAFFVTWVTVLFAPWIFARQIVQHASLRHGLAFAGICFVGTSLSYFAGMDWEFQVTWLLTALIYIPLQALWLSALDPAGWRKTGKTLRFWLITGCYTSAVMLTEVVHGPPLLLLGDLLEFVMTGRVNSWLDELYEFSTESVLLWTQLGLWIIVLCCVYAKRVTKRPHAALVAIRTVVVGASLLVLYGAAVQWIGAAVCNVFD